MVPERVLYDNLYVKGVLIGGHCTSPRKSHCLEIHPHANKAAEGNLSSLQESMKQKYYYLYLPTTYVCVRAGCFVVVGWASV